MRLAPAGVALALCVGCSRPPSQPLLALTGGTVIDVRDGSHLSDAVVLIQAGHIVAVGPARTVPVPSGAVVLDVRGKYVIPGLWDVHTHIQNQRELDVFVPLLIAHGVLGIRDLEGLLPSEFRTLGRGQTYMPHVVACGKYIDGRAPAGEADAAIVDELAAKGVDCIKVGSLLSRARFLAIAARARELRLPLVGHVPIEVNAADASAAGLKTMEHLWEIRGSISTQEVDLRDARLNAMAKAKSTADTERVLAFPPVAPLLSTWNDARAAALFETLRAHDTWQTPTIITHEARLRAFRNDTSFWRDPDLALMPADWVDAWHPERNQFLKGMPPTEIPPYLDNMAATHRAKIDLVRRMHGAGVRFLAGTDISNWNFVVPGRSLHSELAWLTQAGLSPLEALQSATLNPAIYLGIEDSTGTVAVGKRADLLVVDGDPTVNIANTRRIQAVILGGRLIDRSALNTLLDSARARARTVAVK